MSGEPKSGWSDEKIIDHIKSSAVEQSELGFNYIRRNRIMDRELFPCQAILANRGVGALLKLLPLTIHKNSNVRLVAASFAYDAAPASCRRVLEELMSEPDATAVFAWTVLAQKNPEAPPDTSVLMR